MRPEQSSSALSTASKQLEAGSAGLLARAQEALRCSDAATALALCEAAVAQRPQDAEPRRHLAVLLAASGERVSAIREARKACELAADDPRAWSDFGRVRALLGDIEEAAHCFHASVELDKKFADGWHNLGTALACMDRHEQAFTALKNALLLDPTRAETYLELGNVLIGSGQFDDALESFERAARLDPTLAKARSRLADFLSTRGKPERARILFRESLGLDDGHIAGWLGLGRVLEDLGDAHGALGCYRNVLTRQGGHAGALGSFLALLRAEAPLQLLEATRKAMSDTETHDESRALIAYGLAKYHDRRGEYREAAAAGRSANAARRRVAGALDRDALLRRVDGLIERYDSAFFASRRAFGMGTDQAVLIVGLPRSGTTLTEQIIAAHPLLHGAGELQELARLATHAVQASKAARWEAATVIDVTQSRALAQAYLRTLRDGAPKQRLRISDKAPLNFFQLAFAATLFPNARVIHCVRQAPDNALSIWMENFNVEQRYATDFGDLAFYQEQYQRLMAHWSRVLPLKMLEVAYEDTVAHVETQARRIMKFLEVPWDRRCLDFHESSRAVQTPSRWQVRQPIYSRSVERWRRYAQYLPELEAVSRKPAS